MIQSRKCAICDHVIEANGFIKLNEKARLHWGVVHNSEYKAMHAFNTAINDKISDLRKQTKSMFAKERR